MTAPPAPVLAGSDLGTSQQLDAKARSEVPPGLRQRALRRSRYTQTLGRLRGGWLSLREALGGHARVSVRFRGHRLTLRLNSSDILVMWSVFEREDYGLGLTPPPRTIIDAGAYIGLSAVYFADKYPGATILALEPDPANFTLLRDNVRSHANIIPLHQALWHRDGHVDLRDPGTGHWAFYLAPTSTDAVPSRARVEAVCVPTLIERFGLDRVDLLKLNVEGAEKEIFEHCGEWIGRVRAIFAALHDRFEPGCTEAFEAATTGFACVPWEGMRCALRPGPVSALGEPANLDSAGSSAAE